MVEPIPQQTSSETQQRQPARFGKVGAVLGAIVGFLLGKGDVKKTVLFTSLGSVIGAVVGKAFKRESGFPREASSKEVSVLSGSEKKSVPSHVLSEPLEAASVPGEYDFAEISPEVLEKLRAQMGEAAGKHLSAGHMANAQGQGWVDSIKRPTHAAHLTPQ